MPVSQFSRLVETFVGATTPRWMRFSVFSQRAQRGGIQDARGCAVPQEEATDPLVRADERALGFRQTGQGMPCLGEAYVLAPARRTRRPADAAAAIEQRLVQRTEAEAAAQTGFHALFAVFIGPGAALNDATQPFGGDIPAISGTISTRMKRRLPPSSAVHLQHRVARCRGPGKGVQYEVAWVGGDLQDALDEACGLGE